MMPRPGKIGRLPETKIARFVDDGRPGSRLASSAMWHQSEEAPPHGRKSVMGKHYRLLAAAAIASVAVTGVTAASAASAAPQPGGSTEYIQIMSASANGGPASAIARGAFTAAGEAHFG